MQITTITPEEIATAREANRLAPAAYMLAADWALERRGGSLLDALALADALADALVTAGPLWRGVRIVLTDRFVDRARASKE